MAKRIFNLIILHQYIKRNEKGDGKGKKNQKEFLRFLLKKVFIKYPDERRRRADYNPYSNFGKYLKGQSHVVDEDAFVSVLKAAPARIKVIKDISSTLEDSINTSDAGFLFAEKTDIISQLNIMIKKVTFAFDPQNDLAYYNTHKMEIDNYRDIRDKQYREYFSREIEEANYDEKRLFVVLAWLIIMGSVGMRFYEIGDFWSSADSYVKDVDNSEVCPIEYTINEHTGETILEALLPQITLGAKKQISCENFATWLLLDSSNPINKVVISGDIGAGKSFTLNNVNNLSRKWKESPTKMQNCRSLYNRHTIFYDAGDFVIPDTICENALIIIDGLDQVDIEKEREILKNVQECLSENAIKVILSTRYVDNNINTMILMGDNAIEARLCSIDLRKVPQLQKIFFAETEETLIKSSPLMASLYMKLLANGKPIRTYASKHELMDEFFDTIFVKEDLQEYLALCSALAWEKKTNSKFSMNDDFFNERMRQGISWSDFIKKYYYAIDFTSTPEPFELYKIFMRRGIFCKKEEEIVFSHEAFADYLAARFVCEILKKDSLDGGKNSLIIESIIGDIVSCKNVDEIYRRKISFAESTFFSVAKGIALCKVSIDSETLLKLGITIGNYDHHGAGLFELMKPLIEEYFNRIDKDVNINIISAICGYLYEVSLHYKELNPTVSVEQALFFVKDYQEECASILHDNDRIVFVDPNYRFGLMKSINPGDSTEHIRKTILSQTHGNLGAAFRRLADIDADKTKMYVENAIEQHKKGLEYKIETGKWIQSGYISIARDYFELSRIENKVENIKNAVKEYELALEVLGLNSGNELSDEQFNSFDYRSKVESVSVYLNLIRCTSLLYAEMDSFEKHEAMHLLTDCFAGAVCFCIKCLDNHVAEELLKDAIIIFDREIREIICELFYGKTNVIAVNGDRVRLQESARLFNEKIAVRYGMEPFPLE